MGKSVSRCGGRVREVVTCSRGLKKQEKEDGCDGRSKLSTPQNKASKMPTELPQDTKAATSAEVVKATSTTPSKEATCGTVGSGSEDVVRQTLPGGSPAGDGTPLSELEQQQEAILQRLAQLQQDVQKLSTEAGIPVVKSSPVCTSCPAAQNQYGVIQDIVVNADPDKPPLSLFIILKLLAQNTKILTTAHVHSSVTNIDSHLKEIFINGPQGMRADYQFAVTLVWKKEDHSPSMMVDPHRQCQVIGEANIARYLARLFMPVYDSSDPVQSTLIDTWLDIATHQLLQGNSKEKAAAVRNLNSQLGKNEWLVGSSVSLADIVAWSALHQVGLTQDIPANVQKWICSCRNLPEFQLPTVLSH